MAEEEHKQDDTSLAEMDKAFSDALYYWGREAMCNGTPPRISIRALSQHTPSLAAYVMARAAERQEATVTALYGAAQRQEDILKATQQNVEAMRQHSDVMRRQSTAMLWLTGFLMLFVVVQIIITLAK